ncbi:MAG: serine/threonine protein kinase [Oscillatoria princeps RMCB-10]|jgi:serine/threonine-protein kinase|nr:serine/threonine protein kinase [Oscillatoria princeps RMCB-10]
MLGQTLGGRYHIIRELGKGGFGRTFLAEDRQMPYNPRCAVKQLKPQATDPFALQTARRLFDTEAKTLYELGSHPQIPRLLAHFEENQEFFLVEEFIEGHELSQELTPGKAMSEVEVIALLRDILEVLAFVQQHGVIHRDLKPSNLIRRDLDGKIVLIDFGAVKQISTQVVETSGAFDSKTVTLTVAVGTPKYMPSEQAEGQPKFCSDIYALGIIGIQALTGIPASQLSKDPATAEVIWRNRLPVSDELAALLDRMVRYDFRERCQTAAEALQALDSLNNSITSPSAPPPPTVPPTPPDAHPRPTPWKVFTGAGIAAVLSVSALGYYILAPKSGSLPYENSNLGVKIQYPEKWGVQPDPIAGEVRFFSKGNSAGAPAETFLITVESLQPPVTLDKYTSSFIQRLSKEFTADILSPTRASLANRDAGQVVYAHKRGERRLKTKQIWAVDKDKAYVITLTAEEGKFAQFEKTAQKMIDSLEIRP